jgi:hypothetical protein
MCSYLGSCPARIDGIALAVNNIVVNSILHMWRAVRFAEQALGVGFILRKKQRWALLSIEESLSQLGV